MVPKGPGLKGKDSSGTSCLGMSVMMYDQHGSMHMSSVCGKKNHEQVR